VREEDVVDLDDLCKVEGGGDRPPSMVSFLADQEARRPVPGKLAAIGSEDLDAHPSVPEPLFHFQELQVLLHLADVGTITPSGTSRRSAPWRSC